MTMCAARLKGQARIYQDDNRMHHIFIMILATGRPRAGQQRPRRLHIC